MARIQRPAIQADIRPETAQLDEPLRAVVTRLAERLERAEPKFVDVASMRLNVITDFRRGYDAALEAKLTKRMLEQLVLPDPGPALGAVPSIPSRRLPASAPRHRSSSDAMPPRPAKHLESRIMAAVTCMILLHTPIRITSRVGLNSCGRSRHGAPDRNTKRYHSWHGGGRSHAQQHRPDGQPIQSQRIAHDYFSAFGALRT